MAVVEVRDLVKTFPAHRSAGQMLRHPFSQPQTRVLEGVFLSLERGEILGVLGSNGAGKTTLLKIIATVVAPTAGSVRVNGWDVVTQTRRANAEAAYCFTEDRSFYWRLSGRQNLEFFAALDDLHGKVAKRRIDETAERLAIGDYLERPFAQYSSGIRQRFALARALLRAPRVLLLDEPTRSVDPAEAKSIWSLIRDDLVRGGDVSVVLVTHQTQEAVAVCDRVAILEDGKLPLNLPPADLQRATLGLHGLTITLEGFSAGQLPRLKELHGVRDVTYIERNGEQQIEVWCDNGDLALAELVAATTAAGARVRALSEAAPVHEILTRLLKGNGYAG